MKFQKQETWGNNSAFRNIFIIFPQAFATAEIWERRIDVFYSREFLWPFCQEARHFRCCHRRRRHRLFSSIWWGRISTKMKRLRGERVERQGGVDKNWVWGRVESAGGLKDMGALLKGEGLKGRGWKTGGVEEEGRKTQSRKCFIWGGGGLIRGRG